MLLNCCAGELLRVPWTAERSNQSTLKEINPEYSLEALMLKLQYFGHLMRTANSLEKTPMIGKTEDRKRREKQRIRWLDGITDSRDTNLSKFWEIVKNREAWHAVVYGVTKSWTQLKSDWTIITEHFLIPSTKIKSKWIQDLDVRPATIKLLEEKMGRTLFDVNHSNILFDLE